jgi:hypothetical protein
MVGEATRAADRVYSSVTTLQMPDQRLFELRGDYQIAKADNPGRG